MKITKALASPKLAASLIATLLALCLVSFLVPQRPQAELMLYGQWAKANPSLARMARITDLDNVFASPLFAGVLALLGLNLTVCTLRRMKRSATRVSRVPGSAPEGARSFVVSIEREAVETGLRGHWRSWAHTWVRDGERSYLLLDRTARSRLGSLVMHAGILLLILGGIVSGLTRFTGTLALTEGQSVPDAPASYSSPPQEPRLGEPYSGALITLESMKFDYEQGFITQAHARVRFSDAAGEGVREASVNNPAKWRGKYYLLVRGGHAVDLSVSGPDGVILSNTVVRLGDALPDGSGDTVGLPDGRKLQIMTVADYSKQSQYKERLNLSDPAVRFRINGVGTKLWLRPGESGQVGDLSISVGDVRLWNEFSARKDSGSLPVYLAFAVITVGAAARFGFGKKRMGVLLEPAEGGTRVAVWGTDEDSVAKLAIHVDPGLVKESNNE